MRYCARFFNIVSLSNGVTVFIYLNILSYLCVQLNNPDMRVVIIKEFVKKKFPATPLLDYAIEVEKITTSKVRTFRFLSYST